MALTSVVGGWVGGRACVWERGSWGWVGRSGYITWRVEQVRAIEADCGED